MRIGSVFGQHKRFNLRVHKNACIKKKAQNRMNGMEIISKVEIVKRSYLVDYKPVKCLNMLT